MRRLARSIDGLTAADIRAALSRARITLDIPPADAGVTAPPEAPVEKPARKTAGTRKAAARYDVTLKQLLDAGLIQPGMQLRQRYLGQDVAPTVEPDGHVRAGGEIYNSLSIAAGAARVAVKGPPPDGRRYYQANGWTFWGMRTRVASISR